jgi:hypothetical protein
MINEIALRDVLIALANQNKGLHMAVSALTDRGGGGARPRQTEIA